MNADFREPANGGVLYFKRKYFNILYILTLWSDGSKILRSWECRTLPKWHTDCLS
jgi:hypothetical protein